MNSYQNQRAENQAMRTFSKSALGALFALACGVASALPVNNLVANGSFENGLTGWTVGGFDGQGFPPVAIDYNSTAGYPTGAFGEAIPQNNAPTFSPDGVDAHAAYFVSDVTLNQSLFQFINVVNAGIYQIGFSAYAPANGYVNVNDATFSGVIANVVLANYSVSSGPQTTWQTFSGAYNLTAGTHKVEFVFNTNGIPAKDVVIDQVYVIEGNPQFNVPEPGSLDLLGLGLAGLAAVTRRKQK